MDLREKLIDLIVDAKQTDPEAGSFTEYLADCLINNGVTVQECAYWQYIEREAAIAKLTALEFTNPSATMTDAKRLLADMPAADVEKMSDGYHTFADLYEQRLILSAALAKNNPHAWKSKRHEDGSVPFGGGWFIMGFDTDEGCYTYHYELKDWDLFQCEELDKGRPWDGHTSKDVRRLLSIPAADVAPVVRCRDCEHSYEDLGGLYCSYGPCVDCPVPPDFWCANGRRREDSHAQD